MRKLLLFSLCLSVFAQDALIFKRKATPTPVTFTLLAENHSGTTSAVLSGVNAGEMLLLVVKGNGGTGILNSVADDKGNTWSIVGSGTASASNAYKSFIAVAKVATGGTVTVTPSVASLSSVHLSLSRVSSSVTFPASPAIKDQFVSTRGTTGGTVTGNYTVSAGDTRFGVAVLSGIWSGTYTIPTGWNTVYCTNADAMGYCVAWLPVTANGSAAFTAAGTAATLDWQMSTATLKGN